MLCLPDSDFLISLIKEDDKNHDKVLHIYEKLKQEQAKVIYPITSIVEAATALLRRYNLSELAKLLLEKYQDPNIEIVDIKQSDFSSSVENFNPNSSKHHTPFDSLILAMAKNCKADVILSFDEYYKNQGIKTAWDLIDSSQEEI